MPADGINNPPEHPLKEFVIVVPIVFACLAIVGGLVVFMVDLAVPFISPEVEHRILGPVAEKVWSELSAEGQDEAANEALKEVFDRVRVQGPELPIDLKARVVCMDMANAFALPGGGIAVTSGLLHALEREDELAFILGHEVGHFANRDHIRGLGRGLILSVMMAVVFSAGSVDGDGFSGSMLEGLLAGHSRDQEMEADQLGAQAAVALYGHIQGGTMSMKRLSELSGEGTLDALDFSRSHPVGEVRNRAMAEFAEKNNWQGTGDSPPLNSRLKQACK